MTRHVSSENLARFRADDLSPARSRRVAAHLRNCARCRETSDALAEVPSLLAAVEVPPMPAHLAARIETALAAEDAHRAADAPSAPERAPRAAAGPRSAGVRPAGARPAGARPAGARRRHRRPVIRSGPALRVLAVAGAAVVLVGGGVELLSHTGGPSSSTSGGSASGSSGHKAASGATRPRASSNSLAAGIQYQHDGHTSVIAPARSGMDYRSAGLTRQVNGVLGSSGPEFGTRGPAVTPATTPNGNGVGPIRPALSGCVSLIAAGRTVLLVDIARFDRKPATIIVTARQGSAAAQVWVVGSGCSSTAKDVLAHQALPGH